MGRQHTRRGGVMASDPIDQELQLYRERWASGERLTRTAGARSTRPG